MSLYSGFNQSLWNKPITSIPAHNVCSTAQSPHVKQNRKHQPNATDSYTNPAVPSPPAMSSPISSPLDTPRGDGDIDNDSVTFTLAAVAVNDTASGGVTGLSVPPPPALLGSQSALLPMPDKPLTPARPTTTTVTLTRSRPVTKREEYEESYTEWEDREIVVSELTLKERIVPSAHVVHVPVPRVKAVLATPEQVLQHYHQQQALATSHAVNEEKSQVTFHITRDDDRNSERLYMPSLGLHCVPCQSRHASQLSLLVTRLDSRGVSEQSGLCVGDVIVSINDCNVGDAASIDRALSLHPYAALRLQREGRRSMSVTVKQSE